MEPSFTQHHLIYKVKGSDLYAAIDQPYLRDIRQYAAEYQCLSKVPPDRMVKGILFKVINEHLYELKHKGAEMPIQVNRLEFDTGNLRLSA